MIKSAILPLGAAILALALAGCSEQTQNAAEVAASSAAEDVTAAVNEAAQEGAEAASDMAQKGAEAVGNAAAEVEQASDDEPTASPTATPT